MLGGIYRSSTLVGTVQGANALFLAGNTGIAAIHVSALDAPRSTSQQTYTLKLGAYGGTSPLVPFAISGTVGAASGLLYELMG
jgi:hypothetical protein